MIATPEIFVCLERLYAVSARAWYLDIADDENVPDRSCLLFEVSTEVAAKTGGIYTVIKSKCARTVSDWGDRYVFMNNFIALDVINFCCDRIIFIFVNICWWCHTHVRYCLIGIYRESAAAQEFEPFSPPPLFRETFKRLEAMRELRVHYGRWLVPGYPRCILLEISNQMSNAARCKADLWESYKIETPQGDGDAEVNEVVVFGYLCYWFFSEFCNNHREWPIVA